MKIPFNPLPISYGIPHERSESGLFQSGRLGRGEVNVEEYDKKLKQPSRELRKKPTDAEVLLWSKIRMRQLRGLLFYRQKPLGGYIVDFYCPKAKLVVEVDGGQHLTPDVIEYDRVRDEYLASIGLRVLRITNTDVIENIEGVFQLIESVLEEAGKNPP